MSTRGSSRDDSTRDDQSTTVADVDSPVTSLSIVSAATTDDDPVALQRNILHCFICREPPTDPISASCGDVFCWPCMHHWLQRGPKPCPVCGYTLRRDRDIIPLYGAGVSTSADANSTREATDSIDIPPRPRNPLLLSATQATPENLDSETLTSARLVLTPIASSMVAAYERSIQQLSESLEAEQVRVMRLTIDRMDLEVEVSDLEHRQAELRRAVRDRERVLEEERDAVEQSARRVRMLEERNGRLAWEAVEGKEREKRHVERSKQMAELIARLERRLEVAGRQLPPGWRM